MALQPEQMSFKGTLSTIVQWLATVSQTITVPAEQCPYYTLMLAYIAHDKVPHRPGRREPRAIKRRKKNYQLLKHFLLKAKQA